MGYGNQLPVWFTGRTETFGFDTDEPWALGALLCVLSTGRAWEPLVVAWERLWPGTGRALRRLERSGWVHHQGPVVVDTLSGTPARRPGRPTTRWVLTAEGRRLWDSAAEDLRVVEDLFPRAGQDNLDGVLGMFAELAAADPDTTGGVSAPRLLEVSGMPERSARWWLGRLERERLVRRLDQRLADVRALVPGHWRAGRGLRRQLRLVDRATAGAVSARLGDLHTRRRAALGPVDPDQVAAGRGAEWIHDVDTQAAVAVLLGSPRVPRRGRVLFEPRHQLAAREHAGRPTVFTADGPHRVPWQPDAQLTAVDPATGAVELVFVEYERFRSRRDGWNHIERFLGWVHLHAQPSQPVSLRFLVSGQHRVRSYAGLLEAFGAYAHDQPERMPAAPAAVMVTDAGRLADADDPLDARLWYRVVLGGGEPSERTVVLHEDPEAGAVARYLGGER